MQTPKQYLYSEIRQSASKLDIVVGLSAVFAAEGADEDFSEEGDVDHEYDGGAGEMAAGTLSLGLGGVWVLFDFGEWVGLMVLHLVSRIIWV